jgi:hypothetical protein
MSRHKNAEDGYILLMVMWLLVLGSAVAAATLAVAMSGAISTNVIEADLRRELLVRSAVDQIIHDLVRDGHGTVWLRGPRVVGNAELAMIAHVTAEAERLDLLSAPRERVEQFLGAQPNGTTVAAFLARSPLGPAGLAPLARICASAADDCVLDGVTLYSGLPAPVVSAGQAGIEAFPTAEAASAAGEAFRIELTDRSAASPRLRLIVIIRITGSEVTPFWVQDWFWTRQSHCVIASASRSEG